MSLGYHAGMAKGSRKKQDIDGIGGRRNCLNLAAGKREGEGEGGKASMLSNLSDWVNGGSAIERRKSPGGPDLEGK